MSRLSDVFSIYIDLIMLCIGFYMVLLQSKNLIQVNHLNREGQFVRVVGWIYIIIAIIGFVIVALS